MEIGRVAAKVAVAGVLGLSFLGGAAQAVTITAHITADNHYGLYCGQADGSELALVGRNEIGAGGAPGAYNWSLAETHVFEGTHGDYLYVVAWNDDLQQSWLGDFTIGGKKLLSNNVDWEYALFGGVPQGKNAPADPLPSVARVQGWLEDADEDLWRSPGVWAANGASPWGMISGVDADAQFLWADSLGADSAYDKKYLIFRTVKPAVAPEPATMTLLGTGLLGLARLARRRKS